MLGTYYTLQALMGAIMELIIKLLIALAIIIVGLWVMPFTWPAAASMTAVFLGISVPLSIIIYFMSEVLHIKSSAIPKLRCFDKNTKLILKNGTIKTIKNIQLNDVLFDDSIITSKIKVLSKDLDMYNLNGIVVSGCHIVSCNNNWIPVCKHPNAKQLTNYNEPYIYCLNTTSKTIVINDITFTDWDEIYDTSLNVLLQHFKTKENINKTFNKGFKSNAVVKTINGDKHISKININDELIGGGMVYGIVELTNMNINADLVLDLDNKYFNLLVTNGIYVIDNEIQGDYNKKLDLTLEKAKNII
jgi:hypothetical protein